MREYLTDGGWRVRASRRHVFTWVNSEEDARAISAVLSGAGLMTAATRIEIERQAPSCPAAPGFPSPTSCRPEPPSRSQPMAVPNRCPTP